MRFFLQGQRTFCGCFKAFPCLSGIRTSIVFILLLLVSTIDVFSQEHSTVTGHIIDSIDHTQLPYATIGIYRSTSPKKALYLTLTDVAGRFRYSMNDTGSFFVLVSYSGYHEKLFQILKLTSEKETIDLGTLSLARDTKVLKKVIVNQVVQRPLVEMEEDKLVYNVEGDASMQGQYGIDVMRKTPFVSVDANGTILLKGQSNFLIFVNGRRSVSFDRNPGEALKSYPANIITKVEVMTNPSSKYDAEGNGGIINIITKKKVIGYNAGLSVSANSFGSYSGSGNLNMKYGKLGLAGNYSFGHIEAPSRESYIETISFVPVSYYKRILAGDGKSQSFWNDGTLELTWDADTLNTLSLYGEIGGGHNRNTSGYNQLLLAPSQNVLSSGALTNENRNKYPSYNKGLEYIHKFRQNKDMEFSIKMNHTTTRDDALISSFSNFPPVNRYVINDNNARNKELTIQSDYVYPFKENKRIDAGIKGIFRKATSDYINYEKYAASDDYIINPHNSDNYDFIQKVYSAYMQYTNVFKKVNTLRVGARVEKTDIESNFEANHYRLKDNYVFLFPNIFFSHRVKKNYVLSFAFSQRVRRPYIWDLNPFVDNADSLNVSLGNPSINPQRTTIFETGFSKNSAKGSINLRFIHSFSSTQVIRYFIFDNASGILTRNTGNIGRYRSTGLLASFFFQFNSKWNMSFNFSGYYEEIKATNTNNEENSGFSGNVFSGINHYASRNFSLFANFSLVKPAIGLQGQQTDQPWYNCGGTYKFAKNKLRLTLTAANFITSDNISKRTMSGPNFSYYSRWYVPVRAVSASLGWNFGKQMENVSRMRGVRNDDLLEKR